MHRIATKPGDLDSEKKLESVRQTPSDILFISTADTELSGLAQVWGKRFRKKARLTLGLIQARPDSWEESGFRKIIRVLKLMEA